MLVLLLSGLLMAEPRIVDVKLGPKHAEIVKAIATATPRFVDVEGALRSAKTWTILIAIRMMLEDYPGIRWTMARWNETDLSQKLIPDYRRVCTELLGISPGKWNPTESCFDFPERDGKASRLYAIYLKTGQKDNRYARVRGLTTAGFFINQVEEVPEDVVDESALRLSQPGYPQQLVVDPNPIPTTHWIARKWPADNSRPQHKYIQLAMRDNAHNLDAQTIDAAEQLYPVGHPLRRTKIDGLRGLDVHGKPVYIGAFNRDRHARSIDLLPTLPLCESYDYGFHHPCVIWYQYAPWGWFRVLGGVLGSDLHLDEFLPIVQRYRAQWFPKRLRLQATCDPAGAAENSQGIRGTPVQLLRDWYREHGERDDRGEFVSPTFHPGANQPERRYAATELIATYMRRIVNGDEAFLVDTERWVLAELGKEEFNNFFLDALEAGYVLEPEARHSNRLGTYWIPLKDGFYEHPMNCVEYGAIADVQDLPKSGENAAKAQLAHGAKAAEDRRRQDVLALKRAQAEPRDPDDPPFRRRRGVGRPFQRRGGYR